MKLKTFLKSTIAGFTAFAMVATMLPTNGLGRIQAASTDSNMILHWDMTLNEDNTLKDLTQNNHSGTITGNVTPGKIDNIDVIDMKGTRESENNSGYVTIPDGTIGSDVQEITINILVNITQHVKSSWMFCLGSDNTKYLYLTACSNQDSKMRGGAGNGSPGYDHESSIGGKEALAANEWQNVTVTYKDGGKFVFYKNGVKQAETDLSTGKAGNFTIQDLMKAGDGKDGYIAHSFYQPNDPDFQGKVADFRIYNKELSQDEVTELYSDIDNMLKGLADNDFSASNIDLTEADCLGSNTDKDSIRTDLSLPSKTTINGNTDPEKAAVITKWVSSNPNIITDDGKVTRPSTSTNQQVTMTATVERNGNKVDKKLTFTVLKDVSPATAVKNDSDALVIPNMDNIRGNIYLPASGEYDTTITWTSSNEAVISPTASGSIPAGKVTRPADADANVKLTATVSREGAESITKEFDCTVKKAYEMEETTDYIFAYFPYAGVKDERIYFGTSRDGLNFTALNNGKFILESRLGTHGLRDPFIIRSHEGDRFFLIATDLTVAGLYQDGKHYPGDGWGTNQTQGSQKIMVWESTDLIHWSEQRECKVAKDNAGCTWAPEAYWDDETEQYVVFWASKTGDDDYTNQRLYYATTRDFYQFSKPQVWIEEAGSVIDTTVIKAGEYYYRYTKNEDGGANKHGTPSKRVYCERSTSLTAPQWEFVHANSLNVSGGQIEGATIFKLNDDDRTNAKNIAALKNITLDDTKDIYCLAADQTGSTVFPGLTDDITTGSFGVLGTTKEATVNGTVLYSMPEPDASHGTIMPITTTEYNNLIENDQNKQEVNSAVAKLTLDTGVVTSDITLPSEIEDSDAIVTWTSSDTDVITNTGKVTRPADNTTVILTATVTVGENPISAAAVTKDFTFTVPFDAAKKADAALAAFKAQTTIPSTATTDLTLPTESEDGVTVTWSSSNPSVITNAGKVTRPANDTTVTLTATLTVNGSSLTEDTPQTRTAEYKVTVTKTAPSQYTVTFDSKGGSKVKAKTVASGKAVSKPANPSKKGYAFAGWYDGKKAYNFKSMVTKNLILTAKWTKVTVIAPSKAPTLKNVTSKQMTVTIKKVSGAAGYEVTYSTKKNFAKKYTKTASTTKTTATIKKLKKGTTYYVKVRAYKKDSAKKNVYSKYSKVKTIKIKK